MQICVKSFAIPYDTTPYGTAPNYAVIYHTISYTTSSVFYQTQRCNPFYPPKAFDNTTNVTKKTCISLSGSGQSTGGGGVGGRVGVRCTVAVDGRSPLVSDQTFS